MNVLSLFSGIGGLELGLERTGGFKVVAQCEIDPFARAVLAKHWPDARRFEDVTKLTEADLAGLDIDVICGGFPCQDISNAGKRAGIDGAKSGLWSEFCRLIRAIRPRYVIVENVAALLGRGLDRVLGDLAACGFDAEWDCIPASAVGAPHLRDRLFVIAYPASSQAWSEEPRNGVRHAGGARPNTTPPIRRCTRLPRRRDWNPEPKIRRVDDGVSANVDRVAALGNAVVPQVAEVIGRAILAAEASRKTEAA